MSRAMLSNSSRATPKTEARETAEQPSISECRVTEDTPDEPGAEMARGARVWRTYVRESDRSDKELTDGRNNELDVLLIFAALFSAISTAFVIGSLGDLKPDPAESSAQTLLVISQTLATIANGQGVTLQTQGGSGVAVFSPSRSTVVVNVLWLLSLSLSVAVSLVAMLAKDWCYKFMSGRTGPIYEQGRRRQERWNGMQRWKMQEVLVHLPGVMHLALLLFAAGLCVYLWDINVIAALPVIVVTAAATCVYGSATILPLADRFCPYSTPATALLKLFRLVVYPGVNWLGMRIFRPKWLASALWQMIDWLNSWEAGRDSGPSNTENSSVPMDIVTSQMLAWLITNCEDSRSVDTALQAISGANASLPHEPLAECGALYLAVYRLEACVKPDLKSEELTAEELLELSVALRYSRACVALASGDSHGTLNDRWHLPIGGIYHWPGGVVFSEHTKLLKLVGQKISDTGMLEIAAAAAAMPLCHWKPECETELAVVVKALDTVKAVLGDYLQGGATRLSPSVLQLLVEASAHPLVSYWPGDEQHDSQVLLSILLTRVFFTCFKIAPDAARAAAIALAAAAFARDTYPGGEKPTLDDDSREKRAVGILQHYRKHQPDGLEMSALFIFGFFGLLPRLIPNDHDMQPADIIRLFKEGLDAHPYLLAYPVGRDMEIRTLPKQFSLVDHAIKPVYGYLASSDNDSDGKLTLASACLLSLSPHWGEDQRIYLIAAIALCRTKSTDHQKLCMKVMNEQQLPREPLESLKSNDDKSLLMQLCQALLDTRAPVVPVAALHFGLLVANIMSCEGSLGDRQSVLRPLLSLCDRTPGCKEPNPLDMGDLLSYLERSVANGPTGDIIQYTMRSIADFCDPDLSLNPGVSSGSGGRTPGPDWQDTLWGLKDGYRTSLEDLKPVGTEELGGFSPVPISAEEPGATPADTETAETSHERDGNAGLK